MIESRNVQVCTCGKCGREFIPLRCPSCKSPNWNASNEEKVAEQSVADPKPKRKVKALAPAVEKLIEDGSVTRGWNEEFVMTETQLNVKRKVEESEKQPIVHKASKRETVADQQPIVRQSRGKAKELPAGTCPHNFLVLAGGMTSCPTCKRLAHD